jgi:hypothetical protein
VVAEVVVRVAVREEEADVLEGAAGEPGEVAALLLVVAVPLTLVHVFNLEKGGKTLLFDRLRLS